MEDRTLHTSIWARKSNRDAQYFRRTGDWVCPSCGFLNFQRRTECIRCSHTASGASSTTDNVGEAEHGSSKAIPSRHDPSHHDSNGDHDEVRGGDSQMHMTSETTEDSTKCIPNANSKGSGLSTSRWAPWNSSKKPNAWDGGEVWTRVVPSADSGSNSHEEKESAPASIPPDLGLPYEVQHYILAMIQRILEEACYDFASRWIPNTLNENAWTCSEAVELSTWRKTLPTALPPNAIVPVKNYSLDSALADAVRIRNAAVHRHLCDNAEIRSMALKAQDLMSMFSDVTRQGKFHRLWTELRDWDATSQHDPQGARTRLQDALQEISERPVDDMDWTPNAVSLREITTSEEGLLNEAGEQYVDEMELD